MKTSTIKTFFNHLGITTNVLDERKGLLELPYLGGMVVAISNDRESQADATAKFREVSARNKTMVISAVNLSEVGGSTVVPGVDVRVPVFSVFAGRFEDSYPTNGHRITNNRLVTLMKELEELNSGKTQPKTPYLSWLCKAMGITRPRTLEALQNILIEAGQHEEALTIPAIHQLLVGRGTRHAVLTVAPTVEHVDTEPVVNESDWVLHDLERLVVGGISNTQASVIRKTAKAFDRAIEGVQAEVKEESREMVVQMLAA